MKKMTYDEYERFCIEKREQFYEEFDEFIDMENPADLKFNIDFGEIYSIAAVNKDADVVAAFLPDDDYIFYATSVSEVIKYIGIIYPEYKEELMDNFVELQGMHRIHCIEFFLLIGKCSLLMAVVLFILSLPPTIMRMKLVRNGLIGVMISALMIIV